MKKRWFLLTISSILFMTVVLWIPPASADDPSLTVYPAVDYTNRSVTVTGTISSGAGQQVTILVSDASGDIVYLDQTTSGHDGSYLFQYLLDNNESGEYNVKVGGTEVDSPAVATFTVDSSGSGSNDDGDDGSQGDDNDDETEHDSENALQQTYIVDASKLKPTGSHHDPVTLIVPEGKDEVRLPLNAAELLGENSLRLQIGPATVTVPSEVLAQLRQLVDHEKLNDTSISFLLAEGSREEAEDTIPSNQNGTMLRVAGQVMHLDLSVITNDGVTKKLSDFSAPMEVAFSYDEEADENLLGLYYYNEDSETWEYAGGEIDAGLRLIVAKLYHFSTYAVLEYEKRFEDVPASHWAHSTIKVLTARHVIHGVSDTSFAPHQTVDRAAFTALLVRALGLKSTTDAQPFIDVPSTAWYAREVAAAYEAGIISGRSDDQFAPQAYITREEMAALLVRAYAYVRGEVSSASSSEYADQDEIAPWAEPYVNQATEVGLMIGTGHHKFAPKALATRAEAAQAIYNLLMQFGK